MDNNHYDFSENEFLLEKSMIKTIQNDNKINKNNNINQIYLKQKTEEKNKINEKLPYKTQYNNKVQKYENKSRKKNLKNNKLQNLENINYLIKFDKSKLIIGQNNSFIILPNKNKENKVK